MMNRHVVVAGSLNMDLVVNAARLPQAGETILGGSFATFPGGKGANQAVAVARMGAKVKMIGRVGADAFGETLLQALAGDGVDAATIWRDAQAPTGVALITVASSGQNTIVVSAGANTHLTPDDIDAAGSAFEGAGALLAQLECPLPAVIRAAELARRQGSKVILNPSPAQALAPELLSMVDYLIPNQRELMLLAGGALSMEDAIAILQRKGASCIIVTLGEEGVLVADGGQRWRIPAHAVTAVDSVAAGDAFAGAFAAAICEGRSLREAAAWGNAAGAIAVTRPGAQPSLPTRKEVLEMVRSIGSID
jgi:ribokinase